MLAIFPTDLDSENYSQVASLKSGFWLIHWPVSVQMFFMNNHVNSIIKMSLPLEALVYYNFFQRKISFPFVNLVK